MAIHLTNLVYPIILIFSIFLVLVSASSPTLVLNLIHSNQIYSLEPPRIAHIDEASVARLDYLQAKATGDIIAQLSPTPKTFLVNISIGSPPVMQLLHMDTGSDLLWVQCLPCSNCYSQSLPILDPARSDTYQKESCKAKEFCKAEESCKAEDYYMPSLRFNPTSKSCEYSMKYMDGTESSGTLAKETLTFNTIYDEISSAYLENVVFGCGHNNHVGPQKGTGILGLGYGKFSLVHQFGSKFSYCFGSLVDPSYSHNVLVIGDDGANILGDVTPLEVENGFYYVRMEAISVAGTLLPIDQWVFERDYLTESGGTIIDTGTTLTNLVREAYEQLKETIEDVFDGRFPTAYVHQSGKNKVECYHGDYERDLVESGFPIVTFHFSDGAELSLDVKSVFMKAAPDIFCLAVAPSIGGDLNIIGAMAQQSYNIGYDLKAMKVSFEKIDCGILFDY